MRVLRTPEERFRDLPAVAFEPRYVQVPTGEDGALRMAYLDEGPRAGEVVLLLHGEPSWSFLYRKMIPGLVSAGLRAQILAAAQKANVALVDGGCYGATPGPRQETKAEIARMRRDGCDLVGMTGMPEAGLARELGLEFACLSIVANWAAGCGDAGEITLAEVLANVETASTGIPPLLRALLAS